MSLWEQYGIYGKVRDILRDDTYEHHLGRPWMTPFQIAVEFDQRHHADAVALGFPMGGLGSGDVETLPRYIGRQLSREIKAGRITDIEGSFLSNSHLQRVEVNGPNGEPITPSCQSTQYPVSLFRLVG